MRNLSDFVKKRDKPQAVEEKSKEKKETVDPAAVFGKKIKQSQQTLVKKAIKVSDDEFDDDFGDLDADQLIATTEAAEEAFNKTPRKLSESNVVPEKREAEQDDKPLKKQKQSPKKSPPKKSAKKSPQKSVMEVDPPAAVKSEPAAVKSEPTVVKSEPNVVKKTEEIVLSKMEAHVAPSAGKQSQKMILPVGVENCLQGLSFVFTGDLKDLSRQDAEDIVKRYGGRVMGQPSSKTSYVVVGEAAGPKKLELARVHNLSILDQDQFCDLVRTAKPKLPTPVKKDKGKKPVELATHEGELWTVKYKPNKYAEVIGNKGLVEKLAKWVVEWERNRVAGFPKGETSQFKAALLSGPPGIGKTTAAHLVGNIEGFEVIEFNASDTRNKKSLEMFVKEATTSTSISQMMAKKKSKKIIVMDEVDGMSAGDRGGSTELLNLIKKTKVPIICICNDRSSPKMKTLGNHCLDLKFRKPSAQQAEERLGMICRQEGLQLSPNVISQLIASTGGDVRQILNLLSTYRIKNTSLTFDQSKQLAKQSQKNIAKSPFEVASQLFSKEYFRTASLTDRIDLFFQDFSLIPLFVQENYLKTSPAFGSAEKSKKAQAHNMNLLAKASDSISASNLLEAMQQREQQWGLLPTIAVMSTVTPCFYTHGHMSSFPQFPSWLGQFSKSQKTKRILRELKTHMRLKISSDTDQLRLQYLPTLVPLLKKPLMDEDLEKTLDVMDAYFITREDVDGIQELGFEFNIPSKTKTAFTRAYNKRPHLQPYAEVIGKPKKITSTEIVNPDDELVMETEQVQEEEEEEEEDIVVPAKKPTKQTKKGKKKA